jgi:hypothetical protein
MRSKKDELYKIWKENPNWHQKKGFVPKVAAELQMDPSYAHKMIKKFERTPSQIPDPESPTKGKPLIRTVTLDVLVDQERLDIKKIIKEGIKQIPSGSFALDENFRRDLRISVDRWKEYSREECFDPYRAMLPNRKIVWGKIKSIAELKQQDGVM